MARICHRGNYIGTCDCSTFNVVDSCSFGTDIGWSAVVHRDWMELIGDESDVAETWSAMFYLITYAQPSFLLISSPSSGVARDFMPTTRLTLFGRNAIVMTGRHMFHCGTFVKSLKNRTEWRGCESEFET